MSPSTPHEKKKKNTCTAWRIHNINILEPTTGVTFFNSGSKSDPTELFPFIVQVIAGEKRFPPPTLNLKIVRIQRGGGSWMLLDALLRCWEGPAGPRLKNVMYNISSRVGVGRKSTPFLRRKSWETSHDPALPILPCTDTSAIVHDMSAILHCTFYDGQTVLQ
jgi:hypothetical protein